MISDPNLVLYACVASGPTILADFAPIDPNLVTVASDCLQCTPPNHSMYSQTVNGRTYGFLIDGKPDPFVYFGIFDESLDKSEVVWFLNGVKDGFFNEIVERKMALGINDSSFKCFQDEMDVVFRRLLDLQVDGIDGDGGSGSSSSALKANKHNVSSDSSCSSQLNFAKPLLGRKNQEGVDSWTRNGVSNCETKVDVLQLVHNDESGLIDDSSVSERKGGDGGAVISYKEQHKRRARKSWLRRVWLVLSVDLFVCIILFGVWLWICKGFECIVR